MSVNHLLLNLVISVLGKGKSTSKGNYAFPCPECKHHKPKFEVNFDETSSNFQFFNCWVCGYRGKSLLNLFRKQDVSSEKLQELKSLVKVNPLVKNSQKVNYSQKIELPQEFKSLVDVNKNDIMARHALAYLKSRKISIEDIIKYNIGFCEAGKYSKMIIIPSYDSQGNLNYFTARNFDKTSPKTYSNPDVSKDIIPFELFVNWNVPLIICEGTMDAITIKRNAVPLLGKVIHPQLMTKIVTSQVQKIYIALDKDALKKALHFCEVLMNEGKEVYLVEIDGKDPNYLGFEKFTKILHNVYPLTFSKLLEKKLSLV
jgi:DNA primase